MKLWKMLITVVMLITALSGTGTLRASETDNVAAIPKVGLYIHRDPLDANRLTHMDQMKLKAAKFDIDWARTEPTPGNFDWSYLDARIADLTNSTANPYLMALVHAIPAWASQPNGVGACGTASTDEGPICEEHLNSFRAFMVGVVTRYRKDGLHYYEILNEADRVWTTPALHNRYGRMFVMVARDIKALDPQAVVGITGMVYKTDADFAFLDHLLAMGSCSSPSNETPAETPIGMADVVVFHYYPRDQYGGEFLSIQLKANHIREKLSNQNYNCGNKPLVMSETGSDSVHQNPPAVFDQNSQANRFVRFNAQARAAGLAHVTWFAERDYNYGLGHANHGLHYANYQPKPAFTAAVIYNFYAGEGHFVRQLGPADGIITDTEGYLFDTPQFANWQTRVVWKQANSSPIVITLTDSAHFRFAKDKYGQDYPFTLNANGTVSITPNDCWNPIYALYYYGPPSDEVSPLP